MLTVGLNTKEASQSPSLILIQKIEPTKDNTSLGRLFLYACTCKCMWSANDRVCDSFLEREKWNGKICSKEHRFSPSSFLFWSSVLFKCLLINSYPLVSLSFTEPFSPVVFFETFYLTAQVMWSAGVFIWFYCRDLSIASDLKIWVHITVTFEPISCWEKEHLLKWVTDHQTQLPPSDFSYVEAMLQMPSRDACKPLSSHWKSTESAPFEISEQL